LKSLRQFLSRLVLMLNLRTISLAAALVCLLAAMAPAQPADSRANENELEFFERKIRPILVARCYECHSGEAKSLGGSLRIDSRGGLLAGGDSGAALVPGEPAKSLLVQAVSYKSDLVQMPPTGKLPDAEIALLAEWVRRGAIAPDAVLPAAESKKGIDFEEGRKFWSFQPVKQHELPIVRDTTWPRQRIDHFVLAKMESASMQPSPEADRRTLLRRAMFDMLGLPPSTAEAAALIADDSPQAYEALVERLLSSPHYGERWGRYWLDLVRYCDVPESWAKSEAQAWLYRDWVVRALNEDMPYDEFVRRQLAADLHEHCQPEDLAALGLLGLSPNYWKELKLSQDVIKTVVAEEWEERIHTLGSALLGLTVACARCHDHKFDPISTHDYYGLAGVLASTRTADRSILPAGQAEVVEQARQQVQEHEAEVKKLTAKKPQDDETKAEIARLKQQIAELKQSTPHYEASLCYGVAEASLHVLPDGEARTKIEYEANAPQNVCVQIRGNPSNVGPEVPRRFLTVLSPSEPLPFTDGSGRRELAQAITRDAASLTARVMVNRVWGHHFGRGLVDTPSNFGTQGSRPTHPQLLDDLAARFIEAGWSLKWLHREILLSATYRQQSRRIDEPHQIDPENRLLWRMNRRRLDVEAWRDAMLASSGALDRTLGGAPADLASVEHRRRTIYGLVQRRELNDLLRLYDFPDPNSHSARRDQTTTPLQQLFVLNSDLMRKRAEELVQSTKAANDAKQIEGMYQRLYQRPPTDHQQELAVRFLDAASGDGSRDEAWLQYAQALLGSNELMFVD
jgi:cytochrome c553